MSAQKKPGKNLLLLLIGGLLPHLTSAAETTNPACPLDEGRTYLVRKGETLSLIGIRCFGLPQSGYRLGRMNGIQDINQIRVGTRLKVPSDWEIVEAKRAAQLELNFWRKRFQLQPSGQLDRIQPAPPPQSEIQSNKEMAVIQSVLNRPPEAALIDTRELLKEDPTLVSARVAEIKLLIKAGKKSEAELRARSLISAHPELAEVKKIREWANLPKASHESNGKATAADTQEFAK
jgi:hypothetical protein